MARNLDGLPPAITVDGISAYREGSAAAKALARCLRLQGELARAEQARAELARAWRARRVGWSLAQVGILLVGFGAGLVAGLSWLP